MLHLHISTEGQISAQPTHLRVVQLGMHVRVRTARCGAVPPSPRPPSPGPRPTYLVFAAFPVQRPVTGVRCLCAEGENEDALGEVFVHAASSAGAVQWPELGALQFISDVHKKGRRRG